MPSKSIDITVDKKQGRLRVNADGKEVSVQAGGKGGKASVSITAGDRADSLTDAKE